MDKRFLRNTHNTDGSYREDMKPVWAKLGDHWLIHLMGPKPMTFHEIRISILRYNHEYSESEEHEGVTALALIRMIEFDMVKVV